MAKFAGSSEKAQKKKRLFGCSKWLYINLGGGGGGGGVV